MKGFGASVLAGFVSVSVAVGGAAGLTGHAAPLGSPVWKASHSIAVGANVTGIVHYGYGDFLPAAHSEDVERDLAELERMGASVIRVFAAYDGINAAEAAARLDHFLTQAEQHHIDVLVTFVNYYGSHQNPPGMDRYYTELWQGIPYLNHQFIAEGFRGEYLDFVRTVVQDTRQHRNIYAWEPGNELQDKDKGAFLTFMQEVSHVIKALDPARPVTSGMIEAAQAGFAPAELYGQLPDVDMVAIHPGNGYRTSGKDLDWALAHGRKAIVEETGYGSTANRAADYQREIGYWWMKGAAAFLVDGFVAKGLPDNGNGDSSLGMDTVWHTDYDDLTGVLSSVSTPWRRTLFDLGPAIQSVA